MLKADTKRLDDPVSTMRFLNSPVLCNLEFSPLDYAPVAPGYAPT
jgi:hypothetical protein